MSDMTSGDVLQAAAGMMAHKDAEIERLRTRIGELNRALSQADQDCLNAEAVITAIADHADCRGRSVWGCMDLIRDTLSTYDNGADGADHI